jgi:hypothetical protein
MASRALLGAAAAVACGCTSQETGVLGNGEFRYVCTSGADQACSGLANDTAVDLPASPVAVGATFQITYAPNSGNGVSTVEGDNGYAIVPASTEIALASGNTIKALKQGYVTLFAQRSGVATIDDFVYVKFSPVASIEANPSSVSLFAGESQQVSVAASDALGASLIGQIDCQWTVPSGSSAIALQSTSGGAVTVQGIANGTATLHATCGGASADIQVTVTGAPTALDGGTNG